MEKKKIVMGFFSILLLLPGLLQPFVVQAAAGEGVKVQVAGLV